MTTNNYNTKCNQKQPEVSTFCNLTEQWKKGELPCGWYYIKISDIVFIDFFEGKVWKNKKDKYIDEVLAPVPSYEEWQELSKQRNQLIRDVKDLAYIQEENQQLRKWCEEFNALDVAKENQRLKELIKEIRSLWKGTICMPDSQEQVRDILTKIDNAIGEK